jgi:hypothetical protein
LLSGKGLRKAADAGLDAEDAESGGSRAGSRYPEPAKTEAGRGLIKSFADAQLGLISRKSDSWCGLSVDYPSLLSGKGLRKAADAGLDAEDAESGGSRAGSRSGYESERCRAGRTASKRGNVGLERRLVPDLAHLRLEEGDT